MKTLTLLLFLFAFAPAIAQETLPAKAQGEDPRNLQTENKLVDAPVFYALDKEEFIFTPEENGYKISIMQNGQEVDYGTLSQTAEEGYFVMTSNINEKVCYGRFDQQGNFRALRYDEKSDAVIEENFMLASK